MQALCKWCSVRRSWRSLLRLCGMCGDCHRSACQEAGIYLQSGGPPWPYGYREGEHESRRWFNKTISGGFN